MVKNDLNWMDLMTPNLYIKTQKWYWSVADETIKIGEKSTFHDPPQTPILENRFLGGTPSFFKWFQ